MAENTDVKSTDQNEVITKHKVLVIDDEIIIDKILKNLQNALPEDMFEVVGALDYEEAVERMNEIPLPTVIVLDIYFPDNGRIWGGAKFAQKIRESTKLIIEENNLKLLDIEIIAYSNYSYWIYKKPEVKTTPKEYARIRKRLRKYAVYNFIDKNLIEDDEGKPIGITNSINVLATRIRSIVSFLEGEK